MSNKEVTNLAPTVRTVSILHPRSGEPIGLEFDLRPMSSPEVERAKNRNLDSRLKMRKDKVSAQLIEQNTVNVLVAATAGWRWKDGATYNGEVPEFNEANLRKVYTDPKMLWIRNILDKELGEDDEFFTEPVSN